MSDRRKTMFAWAGFNSDRIDVFDVDDGWGGFGQGRTDMPCIYRTRKEARKRFQDVRKVEIREVKNP